MNIDYFIERVKNEIEVGLLKGLTYDKLCLPKHIFNKVTVRSISYLNIICNIIESSTIKSYLIDTSKLKWKATPGEFGFLTVIEAMFIKQEVVKEVDCSNWI